jgi:hypothetical protein
MNISRVKLFTFRRRDDEFFDLKVPKNWDQVFVRSIKRSEYTVYFVVTDRIPAEADSYKITVGSGPTCGYVIPGSAILSEESPHGADKTYCAYNLLIADSICRASAIANYDLASDNCDSARSREDVFRQDGFYLITWDKQFNAPGKFQRDFAISLCSHGLVFSASRNLPTRLMSPLPSKSSTLRLKATGHLPDYVVTILGSLVPYSENPFLRFFYLYQVVEHLMGEDFDSRVADVRNRFAANANPSKVELRDILEKFQDATREKSRINQVLAPECPKTLMSVNSLLAALGITEPNATFAERLYRVRNTLFHDYGVLHSHGSAISSICDELYAYLVEKKILASG